MFVNFNTKKLITANVLYLEEFTLNLLDTSATIEIMPFIEEYCDLQRRIS